MDEACRTLRQFSDKTAAVADFRKRQVVLWDSKSAPMRFVQQPGYLSIEQVQVLDLMIWPSHVRGWAEDLVVFLLDFGCSQASRHFASECQ